MKSLRLPLAAALSLAGFAASAEAQAVDYDALETLFEEPVTASVTGAPMRVSDAPATMDIVSAEDIRRSGARNIPDVLATITGLDVRRVSQGDAEIAVRGYNQAMSPRLLVLLNGRQVYMDYYGLTNWELIPVEMSEIRQIEVVRGPGTALFGFNAVSGVINIITYSPLDEPSSEAVARVGVKSFAEVSGVTTLRLSDNAGLRLSGGYYNADEFDSIRRADPIVVQPEGNRTSLAADFLAQIDARTQMGVEATYAESNRSEIGPFDAAAATEGSIWSARLHGASETPVGLVKATAYFNRAEALIPNPAVSINLVNQVQVFQAEDLFKASADHTFRVAGEYRRNTLSGSAGLVGFDLYAASAMWSWAVSPQLSWTAAARYDEVRIAGAKAPVGTLAALAPIIGSAGGAFMGLNATGNDTGQGSYNFGLVFRATDNDTLRLNGGRGIQSPSLIELVWNPKMKPATLDSAEISYERKIDGVGSLRADIFTQAFSDVHIFGVPFSVNMGESQSWAAEAEFKGGVGPWNWKLGYIYQNVDDDLQNTAGPIFTQPVAFEHSTSDGIFVGQIGWKADRVSADIFARGVTASEQMAPGAFFNTYQLKRVPAYVSTGVSATYALSERAEIQLTGYDLTNADTMQFANLRVEPRAYLAIRGRF